MTDNHLKHEVYRVKRDLSIDYDKARREKALAIIGPVPAPKLSSRLTLRMALARAQNHLCGICAEPLADYGTQRRLTIEHVIPQARGGGNGGNIVLAHYVCNERKADRWPTGCELIFLAATNARLDAMRDEESDAARLERKREKRRRKDARRRMRKHAAGH